MNRVAARGTIIFVLVLILLAGTIFFVFEYLTQADDWIAFTGSPYVANGNSDGVVTDRDGIMLLNLSENRTYSDSKTIRMSMVHWLGDRKGSVKAPALSEYASELALVEYDLFNGAYTYDQTSGVVRLSISAAVQQEALAALGGKKGTVAVYNYKTGEIICAVSTPTFDPDNVPDTEKDPERYDGIFLNRFIQSTYTPGSIFKIVTLAAALESIPDIQEQKFSCTGSCKIGADTVTCSGKHGKQSLEEAFRNSCNCAFAEIALQLGADTLSRFSEQFGVTQSITFDGITTAEGNYDLASASSVQVAWSSIGQYTDLVNPCAYLTFVGAIAAGGKGVKPHVVQSVNSGYGAKAVKNDRIMSEKTAKIIQEYMASNVAEKYGSKNFPGMTVCAKTGTAEVGGNKKPNAVFTGFVSDEKYPFAFIAIVEDGGTGQKVCMPIVSRVLAACKEMADR